MKKKVFYNININNIIVHIHLSWKLILLFMFKLFQKNQSEATAVLAESLLLT